MTYDDSKYEGNGLHCLSEAHLISQNAVLSGKPVEEKPVETLQLVRTEFIVILVYGRLFYGLETCRRRSTYKLQ